LAVKIARQPKKIALIGAPSSAAAFQPGSEKAPAALRAAGIVPRLQEAGFEVVDYGDCAPRLFADDEEHRRARNLPAIVAGLNDLKVHTEVAMKSGALVLVLGGDCAQSIGLLTGARRYYKHLNLLWFDRDADLNTPASTPSGRIDGMVVAHIIGRGAPELVRFWGETPLVREPDVTLFGIARLDPPEQEFLDKSPLRHISAESISAKGGEAGANEALTHLHADTREFVLHLDLDVISQEDLPPVNVPASGGMSFADVRQALKRFGAHKNLLGLDIAQYNPDKDPDGSHARKIVDLIVEALSARLEASSSSEPDANAAAAPLQSAAIAGVRDDLAIPRTSEDAAATPAREDAAAALTDDAGQHDAVVGSDADVAEPDKTQDEPQETTSETAPHES
jgi:arginase